MPSVFYARSVRARPLKPSQKFILMIIARESDDKGHVESMTIDYLCSVSCRSRRTVLACIKHLVEAKLISEFKLSREERSFLITIEDSDFPPNPWEDQ